MWGLAIGIASFSFRYAILSGLFPIILDFDHLLQFFEVEMIPRMAHSFTFGLIAIFVMMITNTIHPPAGANPIIVILGGKGINFVLLPVAVGALIIIIFAMIYNRILGRNYPKSLVS